MRIIKITILFLGLAGCLLLGQAVLASAFSWTPANITIGQDQEFTVTLFLDAQNKTINALEGELAWSESLELLTINSGDSIVPLWITEETKNNQHRFSGVIPGGFSGLLTPYSAQPQPGKVLALRFKAVAPGSGEVAIKGAKVLLHDGAGTEDLVSAQNFNFTVTTEPQQLDAELTANLIDKNSPEEFMPEIIWNEDLYDGQWALIFSAQDKGSGIDHYEVKEGRKDFVLATSPYLIKDQSLKGKIIVKAVDKSGQERIVEVPNKWLAAWYEKYLIYVIIVGVILIAAIFFWRKK